MSVGATYQLLTKAAGKQKRIDAGDDEGFNVVEKEERRCKYPKTEVDEFCNYFLNNLYTQDSPRKCDDVAMKDYLGKFLSTLSIICMK